MFKICFVIWAIAGVALGISHKTEGEIPPIAFWLTYGTLMLSLLVNAF